MSEDQHEFAVALSFAGEEREYVEVVAQGLRDAGVRVFYDEFETAELWGKDLAVHLDTTYRQASRFVVAFISAAYASKAWPQHEFKSALAQAVSARGEYLLPVRFDDTDLPGLRPTIHYVDARMTTPAQLVQLILEKLGQPAAPTAAVKAVTATDPPVRLPKHVPRDFNPYGEAEKTMAFLRAELSKRAAKLGEAGLVGHVTERDGRFKLRILEGGELLFALDLWLGGGGFGGDDTISFWHGWNDNHINGATTGTARMVWDTESGQSIAEVLSFSVIRGNTGTFRFSREDLLEQLWTTIVEHIDGRRR